MQSQAPASRGLYSPLLFGRMEGLEHREQHIQSQQEALNAAIANVQASIDLIRIPALHNTFNEQFQTSTHQMFAFIETLSDQQRQHNKRCLGICLAISAVGTAIATLTNVVLSAFAGNPSRKLGETALYSFAGSTALGVIASSLTYCRQFLRLTQLARQANTTLDLAKAVEHLQTEYQNYMATAIDALENRTIIPAQAGIHPANP